MKRVLSKLSLGVVLATCVVACGSSDAGVTAQGAAPGGSGGNVAGGSTGAGGVAGGGVAGVGGTTAGGSVGPGGTTGAGGGAAGGSPGANLTPTSTDYVVDMTGDSGLDGPTIDTLRAGGPSCTNKILYPYAETVYPGGLISPPIMWEGASDAAYVHARYDSPTNVDVQVASGPSNPGEFRIPQQQWDQITRRSRGGTLLLTLTAKSGDAISTCELRMRIAMGNMTGALYYNTYNHPSAGGVGAILRLTLGAAAPEVYLSVQGSPPYGPCVSCHSVSAGGSTLAASNHNYTPFVGSFQSFAVPVTASLQPQNSVQLADATFGGLTPDGSLLLQMGNPQCTAGADSFPRAPNNFFLLLGPSVATLYDTKTGQPVQSNGLDPNMYMWMPQFSPDGRHVVFNHAKPDGKGGTDRRELAMMDFDQATRTFSNLRVIASRQGVEPSLPYNPQGSGPVSFPLLSGAGNCSESLPAEQARGALPSGSCTGPCYPAWPFFTPDGRGVIYSLISEPDFAVAFPGRATPSKSELWYVNVDDPSNPQPYRLDNANRALADEDTMINYYPTVLPVQVGGYYWVFWTSTRKFGHRRTDVSSNAITDLLSDPSAAGAIKKRIWVSAIRASSTGQELAGGISEDPSFPGFYLEGQSETGNTRAFAALNPCKATGNDCESGLDCCTGYCDIQNGAEKGMCITEVKCAKTNERCKKDSDCCPPEDGQPQNSCIAGYCGFVVLN